MADLRRAAAYRPAAVVAVIVVIAVVVRAGALLTGAKQERYAQVMQELAQLNTEFGQNVLHDESHWMLELKEEADLAGLPEFVRAAGREAAQQRKLPGGCVITLSRSSIVPFLTFSERRDLREAAWRAWTSRGEHAGEHDNRPLIGKILALRQELHSVALVATEDFSGQREKILGWTRQWDELIGVSVRPAGRPGAAPSGTAPSPPS